MSQSGVEAHLTGSIGPSRRGLWAEFKLRSKAETVPRDARRQAVCSVIYQNVYVVRPFNVSGL